MLAGLRPVSDALLLNIAEISAAVVGLFLVGVFCYLETGSVPGPPQLNPVPRGSEAYCLRCG
jgi:hypothetical protein